jgi:hypothetical protein
MLIRHSSRRTINPKLFPSTPRVPYGREGEGLHLPPVPEALNRACPDIKYPAQRMSLCEALFSTRRPVACGKCRQLHSRQLPERIWACKI